MDNFRQRFTGKADYARLKVPIIGALAALGILGVLVPTVGFVWFGWHDIPQNRKVLDSLPIPPGAELYYLDSDPNYTAKSLIVPHSWSTLAKYRVPSHTPDDLTEFYISRLSSRWEYCRPPLVPGARFIARGFVVSLDASNAADHPPSGGSFEILVEYDVSRNPCKHLLR